MKEPIQLEEMLSNKYFNGLNDEADRKETLNEWLSDGDFSCVPKNKRHLIKQYMEQEGIPYPSQRRINYHKKQQTISNLTLYLSVIFGLIYAIIAIVMIIETVKDEKVTDLEKEDRDRVISQYLDADPVHVLVEDRKSLWLNEYTDVSYATYQGQEYYVEMKKDDTGTWEILKFVPLPN